MKETVLLITIGCLFFGCKKEETTEFPFDSLVLSSSNLAEINSIKFTKSDTVYFQRNYPDPQQNFYAIISNDKKIELNQYLQNLNINKYKPLYYDENLDDGQSYLIQVKAKDTNRLIFIHGSDSPKELYNYIDSLIALKEDLNFITTKQVIDFGNLSSILPIPPPPPPLKEN